MFIQRYSQNNTKYNQNFGAVKIHLTQKNFKNMDILNIYGRFAEENFANIGSMKDDKGHLFLYIWKYRHNSKAEKTLVEEISQFTKNVTTIPKNKAKSETLSSLKKALKKAREMVLSEAKKSNKTFEEIFAL